MLQLSASLITTEISGAGKEPLIPGSIIGSGLLAVGKVVSLILIVWFALPTLLQTSFTLKVLVTVIGQDPDCTSWYVILDMAEASV